MAWDGSQYLAAALNGVSTSPDLATWTDTLVHPNHYANEVTYVSALGQYVAVGYTLFTSGLGWIATSTDAINWTIRVGSDSKTEVIWDGAKFMAIDAGGRIFTSADGLSWDSDLIIPSNGISQIYNGLVHSPVLSRYVVVSGDRILSSDDGVNWTQRYTATLLETKSAIWTGSKFVAAGWNGNYLDSADGINWNLKSVIGTIAPKAHMEDVAYSSSLGRYVVVTGNTNSSIFTSTDETTWNELGAAVPGGGLHGIVWTGSRFIAVGDAGTVVTSTDGVTWTDRSIAGGPYFKDVQVISGTVVAVGSQGKVYVSADDGINWSAQTTDTTNTLRSVAESPTRAVAVGEVGTVISK
jgi:hypothetical protein